jgi:hypothetical protein
VRFALSALCWAVLSGALSVTANAQTWIPYATLNSYSTPTIAGPKMDSLGNAWVVIDDGTNLSVVGSNGNSGTWGTPYILGPWIPGGAYSAALAVDQSGGVYVVYAASQNGTSFPLMWAKYTPTSGWQAPSVAYNSPVSFYDPIAAIDSAGHLVVVFNTNGIASIVYDPAKASWGRVQNIVPPGANALLPSMAGNTSGSRLALVYLGLRGLEYSFFNSSSARWEEPAPVTGGDKATFNSAALASYLPISVDPSGNVTVVTALHLGVEKYSVGGFHYDGSAWEMTQLVPSTGFLIDIENEGSIAQSPSGAVLVASPTNFTGTPSITVFRYTPGVGWDTETPGTLGSGTATLCAIAWFESSEAVLVYYSDEVEGVALYSNGAWSSGPAIPDSYATFQPGAATAPSGDVVLAMTSAFTGSFGVVATWLEP